MYLINKKRQYCLIALLILLLLSFSVHAEISNPNRASKILRTVDNLWRGSSSHAINTMKVKTKHYTRTLKMEFWSKGTEKSLVRIISPLKEKGVMTLKSGANIYNYLPKTDRKIRLTSGMMMGSWMGSHFTNDDLIKEARLENDYTSTISFEGLRNGKVIIEFTLIPKEDAAVVWGKLILTILSKSLIPLTQEYFDEDMKLIRTIRFTDIKLLAGQQRPSVMRVVPTDKPGEYTEFIYNSLELNIKISDQFFSVFNLKRR